MEYTALGSTGTTVSRICLGCNSFGSQHEWMLDAEASRELVERAIDLGVNFFDTANDYSFGESETILGSALDGYDRDWPVVATTVYFQTDPENPDSGGLSRKNTYRLPDTSSADYRTRGYWTWARTRMEPALSPGQKCSFETTEMLSRDYTMRGSRPEKCSLEATLFGAEPAKV